jgi:U4/U6.U5 tri-snRNP component SNU23
MKFGGLTLSFVSQAGVTKSGVGWHCKVCDCFLRDSHTYLDHINGRKHQKNLGFSMRVERSSKDQVSARLAMLAKEKERKDKSVLDESTESFGDLVKAKDAEEMRRKEERAKQRKERKKMKALHSPQEEADDEDSEVELKTVPESTFVPEELEEEEEEVNPDLAAMMGFSGFK